MSGVGFPRSANGVVTVVDEDQSNEVAMSSFTTRSDGFFFQVEVTVPVWHCGDHIHATATVGTVTASERAILECPA